MRVTPIQTGDVQIKSRQIEPRLKTRPAKVADCLIDRTWSAHLPMTCFLIEHADGPIVVDTGESSRVNDPGYTPRWHFFARTSSRFRVAPEEEVGPQLRGLGVDPGDVRTVVMTHMHSDHAGGLSHFPNSKIVMSDREATMALARMGALDGYYNHTYPDWLEPTRVAFDRDPWEGFDASHALTQDGTVRLIPTPGHTEGHLSVVVDQGDHLVLLLGDAAYSERALHNGTVDGVAQNSREHRRTTERLRALCDRRRVIVAPTHDPETAHRLQEG